MNQVVFLELNQPDAVPFTTLDVIAKCAGAQHHTITRLIQKHENDFKEFGVVRFKIDKPEKRSQGGRPEVSYCLNEQQATLLIMYLQNTPPVRAFKKELVRQFYAMRIELQKQQIEREMLESIRRALADALSTLSTENACFELRRGTGRKRAKSAPTDNETLLKAVAGLVSATETHSRKGAATELADALQAPEQPNRLTRKLNVLQGRLLDEYHIYYEIGRDYKNKKRYVSLLYAPLKLEIKTPLQAVKTTKIRK